MGLAPLLSMPATRRAPHVALAVWPGKAMSSLEPDVAFKDIPSPFPSEDAHRRAIHESREGANGILGEEASKLWREVAFSLPESCRTLLAEVLKG